MIQSARLTSFHRYLQTSPWLEKHINIMDLSLPNTDIKAVTNTLCNTHLQEDMVHLKYRINIILDNVQHSSPSSHKIAGESNIKYIVLR